VYALYAIGFGFAGLLVGWAYFSLMRHSLTQLGKKKKGILQFVALALLRIALFGGGVLCAALVSTWCLIAYALGFVVSRTVAVSRARVLTDFSARDSGSKESNA
jgi:hypothetical protein